MSIPQPGSSKHSSVEQKRSGIYEEIASSRLSEANSIVTSISKNILHKTSISGYDYVLELDVAQRLSLSQLSPKGMIELSKANDRESLKIAIESAQFEQPTHGRSRFASESIEEIMSQFGLKSLDVGLTDEVVEKNRLEYGVNALFVGKSESVIKIFLSQFANFVIALLIAAAIVSLCLGNIVEGVSIFVIITINAVVATYMEKSASNVLVKLASMASPVCKVLRNGEVKVIDTKDVVVGDVVFLETGDCVAADMRLVEVLELNINEALLTGESEDVKKTLEPVDPESPFSSNLVFSSTSVTNGTGKAIVTHVGMETQVGKIANQLKKASKKNKMTPLQRGLNRLGGLIGIISVIILVAIVVVAVICQYSDPTKPNENRNLTILLLAVGFAVSSIPEGLPMIVTISLSLGANDMAACNANIRKLPAVETLGCCSAICSDKTGTLTQGKMTLVSLVMFVSDSLESKTPKAKYYSFFPTLGFDPKGGIFQEKFLTANNSNQLLEAVKKGDNLRKHEQNIGSPTYSGPDIVDSRRVRLAMLASYLNSHGSTLVLDEGKYGVVGNMSEGALVVGAAKAGFGSLEDGIHAHDIYPRLSNLEVPFSSSRKMMITVHNIKGSFGDLELNEYNGIALIKGAPDRLFSYCNQILSVNRQGKLCCVNAGDSLVKVMSETNVILSNNAYRVLLIAMCPLYSEDIANLEKLESVERQEYILSKRLVVLGLTGSVDPPRSGVDKAIVSCNQAGVRVLMITGDQKNTATAIAKQIGIIDENDDDMSRECRELHIGKDHNMPYLEEEEIDEITSRTNVFSRAQPEDKVVIVNSLRRQGYLTAMTGDGVNDAPALKQADIGVAMGINGTEVAKSSAEMVLLDDNFCTIVNAIRCGRIIYSNIQKFVSFLLGTNIGEILYLTLSVILSTLPPVEALQILFLNLMTDGCPAVALSREPADENIMKVPPRPKSQPLMTKDWWLYGNLPHTLFEAAAVVSAIILGLYVCTGVYKIDDLHSQCKYVTLKHSGVDTKFMYYCQSYELRFNTSYQGWVTNINYWDPAAATGKVQDLRPDSSEIHEDIKKSFDRYKSSKIEGVEFDEKGWYRPVGDQEIPEGKVDEYEPIGAAPKNFISITARQAKRARTMSFVSAIWCEMLRAYTVRSWEYFYKVFNRNPWMHMACSISATMTFAATALPGLSNILHCLPLAWWQYLISISLAGLTMFLDEMIPKFLYHRKLARQYNRL